MSNATLTPSVADSDSPDADPIARFAQRLAAGLALSKLERDVQRVEDRLNGNSTPGRTAPRRSRRSAWVPSDWPQ